jgi:uncharacterized Zn-binding protein involved in type VI secretion
MPSVAVNPPKTPVTKGSMGIAAATIPNVCKMPGPPAPFVPTPLPNIGKSGDSPKGYSTTVKVEGQPVAIRGATFGSMGDIASKGTGGGIVSNNTHGPTKFIAPGSMNVKIQGKNVQQLGDQMLNNCGPTGTPANSATLAGTVQPAAALVAALGPADAQAVCEAVCANYTPNKLNPKAPKAKRPSKGTQSALDSKGVGVGEQTQWLPSAPQSGGAFSAVITKAGSVARSSSGCGAGNTVRWDRNIGGKWVELKGDTEPFTPAQQNAMKQGQKPIVVRPSDCGCAQI